MKRTISASRCVLRTATAGSLVLLLGAAPGPAGATIHEIVAAFCSGGNVGVIGANGHLAAPGVSDPTKQNFAQPVAVNGATIVVSENPLHVVIGSSPSAKYPAGTTVIDLATLTFLAVSQSNHPATACKNFSDLP